MERQAISDLLSRYKSAYELKDMDGIRAVFPTIPADEESAMRNFLPAAKTIQLILDITDIQVAGDSAKATARYQISFLPIDRAARQSSPLVTIVFDLVKADGSWIIQRINR
jgi:hypothetical protein